MRRCTPRTYRRFDKVRAQKCIVERIEQTKIQKADRGGLIPHIAIVFQCLRRCNQSSTALNGLSKMRQSGKNILLFKPSQTANLAPRVDSV